MSGYAMARMVSLALSGIMLGMVMQALWFNVPVRAAILPIVLLPVCLILLGAFHDEAERTP